MDVSSLESMSWSELYEFRKEFEDDLKNHPALSSYISMLMLRACFEMQRLEDNARKYEHISELNRNRQRRFRDKKKDVFNEDSK